MCAYARACFNCFVHSFINTTNVFSPPLPPPPQPCYLWLLNTVVSCVRSKNEAIWNPATVASLTPPLHWAYNFTSRFLSFKRAWEREREKRERRATQCVCVNKKTEASSPFSLSIIIAPTERSNHRVIGLVSATAAASSSVFSCGLDTYVCVLAYS